MMVGIGLFFLGLLLSAFFSGSETGFYRATRVRLVLDGLAGDPVARGLLWLTNNPALFVATTLVGNNLANYLTSFAIVLMAQTITATPSVFVELVTPVVFSPIVFVYGELLPKNLFYYSPNSLLRRCGPVFLFFVAVFAPISAVLWGLGRMLQSLLGEAPHRVQLALARKELQQVLEEGQDAGILQPAQRKLAQNLFAVASHRVQDLCVPSGRMASIRLGANKREVLRVARRHGTAVSPVVDAHGRELLGYVRTVDLYLEAGDRVETYRPLPSIAASESHLAALIQMQSGKEELARVVDADGATIGLLYASELTEPLFRDA
ncbi:MAG: CNNM domain-containing protein [Planctomycetota bacterium]|nr:CNNM domain-containing protein [Planctomycetota bacterium]